MKIRQDLKSPLKKLLKYTKMHIMGEGREYLKENLNVIRRCWTKLLKGHTAFEHHFDYWPVERYICLKYGLAFTENF